MGLTHVYDRIPLPGVALIVNTRGLLGRGLGLLLAARMNSYQSRVVA